MDGNDKVYTVRLSKEANDDLWREIDYLNVERQGLGEAFYNDIRQTIDRIRRNSFMYAEVILFVRRGLLQKFKFQLFYAVDDINYDIEIIGILHQKQNSNLILQRLTSNSDQS